MTAVSIITPVYNCEAYIEESLQSIVNQREFDDFEWLILNDGSQDSTWEKVTNFNYGWVQDKIRFINDSVNVRIPRRRNAAVQLANGKYIAIHDGDDASLPDRLRTEFEFLESHPELFCVGGLAFRMEMDGTPSGMMDYPLATHEQIVGQMYRSVNPMIDPTTMFRREGFLELGGYTLREDIYTVPDMHLWCKAILAGKKMANIRKPLIRYRANPNSMTGKHKEEMVRAHMTVWREFAGKLSSAFVERDQAHAQVDTRRTAVPLRQPKEQRSVASNFGRSQENA
tara:strand:+ start:360653 stop:361504 length:852 start_codon:yes stop_codon:yes gene_type:complete